MRILVSGGTGLIGTALRERAEAQGHEVGLLVRRDPAGPHQWRWDPAAGRIPDESLAWADGVVNLSGAPLARLPWTRSYRDELRRSRTDAASTIARGVERSDEPPAVVVGGAAVGYYGDRPGELLDESSGRGQGFLARLVEQWEDAAALEGAAAVRTRVATIRTGLVLAPGGGALAPLMLATRFGLAARVGPGTQVWPWVSLADEVGAILHVLTHDDVSGPVNLVAPRRSTSEHVTRTLAAAMHRPHLLVLPSALLRVPLGPVADEMLLPSQHIEPTALLRSGYRFEHADLEGAVAAAVG